MIKAQLDSNLIATAAGNITVYNYSPETGEYLGSAVEYLAVGVGIPACSAVDAPPEKKKGSAICRTAGGTAWEYLPDHRGETVYNTDTGYSVKVTLPGNYPTGTTPKAPATPFDIWNGTDWVIDVEAKKAADIATAKQRKASLLADAQVKISLWQTELQLGMIRDEDKASLITWLAYIKALQAVDTDTAPDISWPALPAAQAK